MLNKENSSTEILKFKLSDECRDTLYKSLIHIDYSNHRFDRYVNEIKKVLETNHTRINSIKKYRHLSKGDTGIGIIKISNLPVDLKLEKPPENGGQLKLIKKPSYISENILTLISLIFGNPYSIFLEGKGLINNIIPSRLGLTEFTGQGSKRELGYHIENSSAQFLNGNCSPKALLLIGVTQTSNPPYTKLSDGRKAIQLLSEKDIHILKQPCFSFKLPYRWYHNNRKFRISNKPIIINNNGRVSFNGAFYGKMIDSILNADEKRAVNNFVKALAEVETKEIIEPGTIICIDNRVVFHARTPFSASFDQFNRTDRWLQRLFVTDNLHNFKDWVKNDELVFSPPNFDNILL